MSSIVILIQLFVNSPLTKVFNIYLYGGTVSATARRLQLAAYTTPSSALSESLSFSHGPFLYLSQHEKWVSVRTHGRF